MNNKAKLPKPDPALTQAVEKLLSTQQGRAAIIGMLAKAISLSFREVKEL